MDRLGRLEVKTYAAADAPLSLDDYFTVKEAGFSVPAVTELTVRAEEGDVGRTIGEPGVRYVITGNPLLYGLNGMTNYAGIMQNILDGMGARPYAPMEIEARGNPAVQAGDILTVALRDGRTATLPVMTHTLTYNGGLRDTLASTGKAAEAGEQKGAVSESLKALNRKSHVLETDVEHSKSVISEIVTQVPYIGPEPPTDPETGRLWQDEADPPVLREWNGSEWITAADKTTVISSAVQQTKDGITMDFLNDKVGSYMEFTAEGLAIYDSPKGTEGRKTVFGYDTVEQVLKMVGEFTTELKTNDGVHVAKMTTYQENIAPNFPLDYVGMQVINQNNPSNRLTFGKNPKELSVLLRHTDTSEIGSPMIWIQSMGNQAHVTLQAIPANLNPQNSAAINLQTYMDGSSEIDMTADNVTIERNPIWHKGNLKIAHGTVWIAPQAAGSPVYVHVDYSSAGFSGVPTTLATALTAIPQTTYVGISNPTSTNCKVYGVRTGGTGGFTVAWLAIGV